MAGTVAKMTEQAECKKERRNGIYARYIKRSLDFILACVAIIILSPVIAIVAVCVRVNMGKPVVFTQRRAGYMGKEFVIYKFRTMNSKRDEDGNLLPDAERLTGFGKFLRKTSLDELPQLWNILKGDISIIGPRPLLVEYLPIYTENEMKRHLVKPGLVGLAGVNGRNNQSWDSKFIFDAKYVDNISFKMDCSIFFKCIVIVLGQKDIYCEQDKLEEDSFIKRVKENGL